MACTRERASSNFFSPPRLTVRYIGARHWKPRTVRDVTPAEMATKPGPTYHFFRQGTGIPGFRKAVCHPFPPTARRHSGPEWLALPEIARGDDDQSGMGVFLRPKRSISRIPFGFSPFFPQRSGNHVTRKYGLDGTLFQARIERMARKTSWMAITFLRFLTFIVNDA